MGPPPGASLPDAHDCIMVRIKRSYRIQVCSKTRSQWRAPLGSSADRYRPDSKAMQKARLAVHRRSACSGVKALRNTSVAWRHAAKLCYRFGRLTPSARSANLIAGDGTRNGFPAPNKEPATNQKHDLTGKAPYKFESIFLQRRVNSELGWKPVGLGGPILLIPGPYAERAGFARRAGAPAPGRERVSRDEPQRIRGDPAVGPRLFCRALFLSAQPAGGIPDELAHRGHRRRLPREAGRPSAQVGSPRAGAFAGGGNGLQLSLMLAGVACCIAM